MPIGLALLLTAAPALAQDGDAAAFFVKLYAEKCMKHYAKPMALKAEFEAAKTPELPANTANFFLGGAPGKAWPQRGPGEGRFVVSLRDDGICAVFAQHADDANVERRFKDLVSTSPPPLAAAVDKDEHEMSPTGPIHTLSYTWSRPGDESELLFTLTTAVSPDAPVQAMASLGRTKK
ncbi:NMCC_0638 family (lipo)protein [Dyella sp. 2RAB6]|uniref:NMCC_0638 family (lipo)protein n=1 Tax=Dyella sp. 2RAB6 TaxID=3232992 RepID=UPI003F8F2EC1